MERELLEHEGPEGVVADHADHADAQPEPRRSARGDRPGGAEDERGIVDELLGLAEARHDVAAHDDVGVQLGDDEQVELAPHGLGTVLVVGGTGILRPAAVALAAAGAAVSVVSRRAGAADVRADLAQPGSLGVALGAERRFDAALAYAPWATADNLAELAARVDGVLVHVLVSAWAAPGVRARERDTWARAGGRRTVWLTLGWVPGADGEVRWHTPEEVSAGGLAALGGGRAEQHLGQLRPWAARPR
jgi:hypothetical protein